MTAHQRVHTRPRNAKGSWQDYELEKRLWDAENPDAAYQDRDQAMQAIARRLGLVECQHPRQEWRETSFTAGGWNTASLCADCGATVKFGRLSDHMGG